MNHDKMRADERLEHEMFFEADCRSLMRCEACGVFVHGTVRAGAHENAKHEGAQTCWTAAQRAQAEQYEAEDEALANYSGPLPWPVSETRDGGN